MEPRDRPDRRRARAAGSRGVLRAVSRLAEAERVPDRVEVDHESTVEAGLVIVPSGAGGEGGRLCVRDRVHVEVEVHLRRDRAAWPGGRAEVGDGLAGERERARLAFWRQDVDPVRVPAVV